MGGASKAGDLVFKGLAAGLGVATVYLAATFSVNVYRGLAWHKAQSQGGVRIKGKEAKKRVPMKNMKEYEVSATQMLSFLEHYLCIQVLLFKPINGLHSYCTSSSRWC